MSENKKMKELSKPKLNSKDPAFKKKFSLGEFVEYLENLSEEKIKLTLNNTKGLDQQMKDRVLAYIMKKKVEKSEKNDLNDTSIYVEKTENSDISNNLENAITSMGHVLENAKHEEDNSEVKIKNNSEIVLKKGTSKSRCTIF